jgi:hypothetical protein
MVLAVLYSKCHNKSRRLFIFVPVLAFCLGCALQRAEHWVDIYSHHHITHHHLIPLDEHSERLTIFPTLPMPSTKPSSYAFNQPTTAHSSSDQIRAQEQSTFYKPLPAPDPSNTSINPFSDPSPGSGVTLRREYLSRTPSPHGNQNQNRPLLSNTTPRTPEMPATRYGPRAGGGGGVAGGGMPARGESQSALLGGSVSLVFFPLFGGGVVVLENVSC